MENNKLEYWLRGSLPDIPALLQPVAHAILQANAEIHDLMKNFPKEKLWLKPAGAASVGFHLLHIAGVLDRLFTYSRGESLAQLQLDYLGKEGKDNSDIIPEELVASVNNRIEGSLNYLKTVDINTLTAVRMVGRKRLPSTVIGLLFHAAEHTMRHTGQLLVTIKFLNS